MEPMFVIIVNEKNCKPKLCLIIDVQSASIWHWLSTNGNSMKIKTHSPKKLWFFGDLLKAILLALKVPVKIFCLTTFEMDPNLIHHFFHRNCGFKCFCTTGECFMPMYPRFIRIVPWQWLGLLQCSQYFNQIVSNDSRGRGYWHKRSKVTPSIYYFTINVLKE